MQKALPSDGLGEANTTIKHVWIVEHISSSQTRGYQAYFALSVNSHRRRAETGANPAQGWEALLRTDLPDPTPCTHGHTKAVLYHRSSDSWISVL